MENETVVSRDEEIESVVESYLQSWLPDVFRALTRQIDISQLSAASGAFGNLDIDRVELGTARIEKLLVHNTSATIQSGYAFLRNVRLNLELKLTLDWWYDVLIDEGSGTKKLSSLWFAISMGDVRIPELEDIHMTIPSMSVENLQTDLSPISNLDLGGGGFDGLKASDTSLPAQGFQLSGLGLGRFNLSQVQVPGTLTREARIDHFKPDADLLLPEAKVSQLRIPAAPVNNIQTDAFSFDGEATKKGRKANLGIFGVTFWVEPVAHIAIEEMSLQDVDISAEVGQAQIKNVRVPIDVRGINMKQISITDLSANDVSG